MRTLKCLLFFCLMSSLSLLLAGEKITAFDGDYRPFARIWELPQCQQEAFVPVFALDLRNLHCQPEAFVRTFLPGRGKDGKHLSGQPEPSGSLSRQKAFSDIQYQFLLREEINPDGTMRFPLEKLPLDHPYVKGKPFQVNLISRTALAKFFYLGQIRQEPVKFASWLHKNPNFRGFVTWEWGNDALHILRKNVSYLTNGRFGITMKQIEELRKTTYREPKNRQEHVDRLLRNTFDRCVEYAFNRPEQLMIGEGHWCIGHWAAYWGARAIGIETSRNYVFWQNQMMFCRGAARQFDIPWHWYLASYFEGYDSKGQRTARGTLFAEQSSRLHWSGPQFGISLSSMWRGSFMTWLSGASSWEREAVSQTHFLQNPPGLSEEGKMYVRFMDTVRKHPDRGQPYTPVALMVPAYRGYCRFGGKAFTRYEYTHADHMLDAIMCTILDWPTQNLEASRARGIERVMSNSPYGDIFDVLTPDFKDQTSFRKTLKKYPVAIAAGDCGNSAEMEQIWLDYIRGGGTLILSAPQVSSRLKKAAGLNFSSEPRKKGHDLLTELKPVTAEILHRDRDGEVLFTRNRYGKGFCIVGAQHWLSPWYGDTEQGRRRALADVQRPAPQRHPHLEWLFSRLTDELLPLKISGDIQYGLNRTSDGWLLYLINNAGVIKFADRKQQLLPEGSEVSIDLRNLKPEKIQEIISDRLLIPRNGRIRLTVPSGDVAILRLK